MASPDPLPPDARPTVSGTGTPLPPDATPKDADELLALLGFGSTFPHAPRASGPPSDNLRASLWLTGRGTSGLNPTFASSTPSHRGK